METCTQEARFVRAYAAHSRRSSPAASHYAGEKRPATLPQPKGVTKKPQNPRRGAGAQTEAIFASSHT